jgi:hypothetical protein
MVFMLHDLMTWTGGLLNRFLFTGLISGLILMAFQNCGQPTAGSSAVEGAVSFASQSVSEIRAAKVTHNLPSGLPSETVSTVAPGPASVEEAPSTPTLSCLSRGERAVSDQAYFYYRKCDGEINDWKEIFKHQCCSKSVTVQDVAVFPDTQCADGRYEGIAICD